MADTRWRVSPEDAGERLDRFLATAGRLGSRGRASDAIDRGKVFVNDVEARGDDRARRVEAGDEVRVWMDRPGSGRTRSRTVRRGGLDILYEDAAILVVNKPPGMLTVPLARSDTASVQRRLAVSAPRTRGPLPVHRIDRDTSGLVVFAKTPTAQAVLKEQFVRREPDRRYLAVVEGTPEPATGTWRDRLQWDQQTRMQEVEDAGRPPTPSGRGAHSTRRAAGRGTRSAPTSLDAVTHYRVVERFRHASLLEVRLETGRRNQIRVQAAAHGHPLVGERQYVGDRPPSIPEFPRQALHAVHLSFLHPVDGRRMAFTAPMPADLNRLLEALRSPL